MATTELQPNINGAASGDQHVVDKESQPTHGGHGNGGGWITFPFISVGILGLTVAASGWTTNLIVYLIDEFNIKSIDAAQISNIVNGCTTLFPIAGAILADAFFGNFFVIAVSSFISMLGMILLTLTASIRSLRPLDCTNDSETTSTCETPSKFQFAVLYAAIAIACAGIGGTRFTIATMGADQFHKPKDQASFFNWFFVIFYAAFMIGGTGVVYVQDNVGWDWGLGLPLAANVIALVVFIAGKNYYRHIKPHGTPFTNLARVIVATIQKRNVSVSTFETTTHYYGHGAGSTIQPTPTPTPSKSFRFLNRAAIKTEGDTHEDGSIAKPWRLCTVQQVEDLKGLIRIFPLWTTGVFLSTPIGIQSSLSVLQALNMDRHLGPHFKVPAASYLVAVLVATIISLTLLDRFLYPAYQKLRGRSLTPLQRVGIGHSFNVLSMAASAIVEWRRLHVYRSHNIAESGTSVVPMSGMWLVVPLTLVGIGEAFHFPGHVSFYYQEFPSSLRSTSTAMISITIAMGYYLSTAVVDLVRRVTGWLPDDINQGRIDNVFWLLVVIGTIGFCYFVTCAVLYKYQNIDDQKLVKDSDDE